MFFSKYTQYETYRSGGWLPNRHNYITSDTNYGDCPCSNHTLFDVILIRNKFDYTKCLECIEIGGVDKETSCDGLLNMYCKYQNYCQQITICTHVGTIKNTASLCLYFASIYNMDINQVACFFVWLFFVHTTILETYSSNEYKYLRKFLQFNKTRIYINFNDMKIEWWHIDHFWFIVNTKIKRNINEKKTKENVTKIH